MNRFVIAAVTVLMLSVPGIAQAQSDAVATCLLDNTSGRDRKDLMKWMFFAIAAHPEIKQYTNAIPPDTVEASSRTVAAIFTRLMTESCVKEVKAVLQGGTSEPVTIAFRKLGELAMQELSADQSVKASIGNFERYLEWQRFEAVFTGK